MHEATKMRMEQPYSENSKNRIGKIKRDIKRNTKRLPGRLFFLPLKSVFYLSQKRHFKETRASLEIKSITKRKKQKKSSIKAVNTEN